MGVPPPPGKGNVGSVRQIDGETKFLKVYSQIIVAIPQFSRKCKFLESRFSMTVATLFIIKKSQLIGLRLHFFRSWVLTSTNVSKNTDHYVHDVNHTGHDG